MISTILTVLTTLLSFLIILQITGFERSPNAFNARITKIRNLGIVDLSSFDEGLSVLESFRYLFFRRKRFRNKIDDFKMLMEQAHVQLPLSYSDYIVIRYLVRYFALAAAPIIVFLGSSSKTPPSTVVINNFPVFLVLGFVISFFWVLDYQLLRFIISYRKRTLENVSVFFMNIIESNVHNGDNIYTAFENSKPYLSGPMLHEVTRTVSEFRTFGVISALSNMRSRINIPDFDKFLRLLIVGSKSSNFTLHEFLSEHKDELFKIKEERMLLSMESKPTLYILSDLLAFSALFMIAVYPTVIRVIEMLKSW